MLHYPPYAQSSLAWSRSLTAEFRFVKAQAVISQNRGPSRWQEEWASMDVEAKEAFSQVLAETSAPRALEGLERLGERWKSDWTASFEEACLRVGGRGSAFSKAFLALPNSCPDKPRLVAAAGHALPRRDAAECALMALARRLVCWRETSDPVLPPLLDQFVDECAIVLARGRADTLILEEAVRLDRRHLPADLLALHDDYLKVV